MTKKRQKTALALKPGDRIRLVAPASPFDKRAFDSGVQALVSMGYVPVFERDEFRSSGFLAGSDEQRAQRLSQAFSDDSCRAVWCIRGGYGTARLLPLLDLNCLRRQRKLVIGFSDVTALLINMIRKGGSPVIHGPVITQLGKVPPRARRWLVQLLGQDCSQVRVPLGALKSLVPGRVEGRLTGGNLSLLCSLVGTPWFPRLSGAILFIEDVAEPAYRLDRLFNQLVQAGALKGVRGLVLGSLADCRPTGRGPYSARAVLERAASELGIPSVSGGAFGHQDRNVALPIGVRVSLDSDQRSLTLLESAVT